MATNPTIRRGSRDKAAVVRWQKILGVSADGIFGRGTQRATIAWQKARGLTADGIVGRNTWKAASEAAKELKTLAAITRSATVQSVEPPNQSVLEPETNHPVPVKSNTIRYGSRGELVKAWQAILAIRPVDGIFGRGTRTATKNWQGRNSLTADGIVGPNTWKKAEQVAKKLAETNSNVVPIRPDPKPAIKNHPDPLPAPRPVPRPAVRTSSNTAAAAQVEPKPRLPPRPRPKQVLPTPESEDPMTKPQVKPKAEELKDDLKVALLKAKIAPWWQKAIAGIAVLTLGTIAVRKIRG